MSLVKINGIEQALETSHMHFDDYLTGLNQTLGLSNQVIASIKVNGRELTEAEENTLKQIPVEQVGEIEIQTSNPVDLAYETLDTLEVYLSRLANSIARAADLYKRKQLVSADAYFAKSIDGLDLFVQSIGGVKLALRIGLKPELSLIETALVSTMSDLLEAKRQNNYVFLAELLEKDLLDNIFEWKNRGFAILRAHATS